MKMRKLFAFLTASVVAMAATATNYTGALTVVNGGTSSVQNDAVVNIDNTTVTISGITVEGCATSTVNGITTLAFNGNVTTANGDVAAELIAHYGYSNTYATVNLTLANGTTYSFQNVGNAFQLPNSDFETWTATSGEAQHWHGFKSASGSLASQAKSTFVSSTAVRSGATGTKCGVITSTSVLGVIANGTMTNGQLNAGSISAANTANHSHMDRTSTSTDNDGNPFYMAAPARPDAIKVWVKFSQGKANTSYPYATFSAVVYDDTSVSGVTYYQDPENKTYTNVVARAKNGTIAVCDWQELTIPFTYLTATETNKSADAILVTMSTNATPGKGSSGDQLFMDDLSLVYNAAITGVTYKGETVKFTAGKADMGEVDAAPAATDFAVTYTGAGAVSGCNIVETADAYIAYIYVVSADLLTTQVYTAEFAKKATAIKGDVNGDGSVDIVDINAVIEVILSAGYSKNADVNGDGSVDVVDINAVIEVILNS